MYRRLSIENPFSFCGSACEPRSRPASHDGPGPAARMAVKDARSVRAAQRWSAARCLTATAAEGTSTWAGATRFILGRSRPFQSFFHGDFSRVVSCIAFISKKLLAPCGEETGEEKGAECNPYLL